MSRLATVTLTALGTVAIVGVLVLVLIVTGSYNVAATAEHWGLTRWALNTLQHASVSARAEEVEGTAPTDSDALTHGLEHFDAMCVDCHGAPGVPRGETGEGMNPTPPSLSEEVEEWSDAELFWITKHGIRLAGMPAFGPTHGDEEIWGIVALMRRLPEMSEEEYASRLAALAASADSTGGDDGHTHEPGEGHD